MEAAAKASLVVVGGSSFRLRSPSLNSVRLRRIFDIFDKNNDCIITVDELGQALALLGLKTDDLSQLESMVHAYVQPGNRGLRYEDFEALHRLLEKYDKDKQNNLIWTCRGVMVITALKSNLPRTRTHGLSATDSQGYTTSNSMVYCTELD